MKQYIEILDVSFPPENHRYAPYASYCFFGENLNGQKTAEGFDRMENAFFTLAIFLGLPNPMQHKFEKGDIYSFEVYNAVKVN